MSWGIYELVAQRDAAALRVRLAVEDCPLRELDGAAIVDGDDLFAKAAETFGTGPISGWDSFSDRMWTALLPGEGEGDRSALVWEHADVLLAGDLGSFLLAFDVLVSTAREAYRKGLDVTVFLLGDGPNFPPLA